jgi:rRNA maturation endonuclease Nob1
MVQHIAFNAFVDIRALIGLVSNDRVFRFSKEACTRTFINHLGFCELCGTGEDDLLFRLFVKGA